MKIYHYIISVLLGCFGNMAFSMDNELDSLRKPQFLERAYQIGQDKYFLFTTTDYQTRASATFIIKRDFTSLKFTTTNANVYFERKQNSDVVEIKTCSLKSPEKCSTEKALLSKLNQKSYILTTLENSFFETSKTISMECESSIKTHRVEWIYTLGATHLFFKFDQNRISNLPVRGGGVTHDQDANLPDGSTYITVIADIKYGPIMPFMTIFEKEGEKLINKQSFEANYLKVSMTGAYEFNYDLKCNVL